MIVNIVSVDLDGNSSLGHYVDSDGVLRSVPMTYGEALALQREFQEGADSIGYEMPTVV